MVALFDVLGLFLVVLLVFLNGLFVAAEFAFVRIRPTRVDALVEEGRRSASLVREATNKLDDYLAVCQLGITISSLGLGYVGEPAIAALIEPVLTSVLPAGTIHLVALAISFGTVTFLHVVFGELAPKTLSIQDAETISLAVAPPMKFFYIILRPGVIVFNGTANFFTRLAGYPPASESEEVHTEEDIRMLIAQSRQHGHVEEDEEEMIEAVFELENTTAREIMIPRPDVATLPVDMPFDELLSVVAKENYTGYPVLDTDDGEQVIGAVHAEDVLRTLVSDTDETTLTARDLAREIFIIPESQSLDDILAELQTREVQLAVVIDEWGAFEGIVTVEDIVEEIVGDIRDEFDVEEPSVNSLDDGTYAVDGHVSLRTANANLDADFEHADFETVGGLVLDQLGRAPEVGDEVAVDGYTMRVDEVDGTRIANVVVRENEGAENEQLENESPG